MPDARGGVVDSLGSQTERFDTGDFFAVIAMEKVQLENDKIPLRVFGAKYLVKIRVNHALELTALDCLHLRNGGAQRSRDPFRGKSILVLLDGVEGISPARGMLL